MRELQGAKPRVRLEVVGSPAPEPVKNVFLRSLERRKLNRIADEPDLLANSR